MRARRLLDELPALLSLSVLGAGFVSLVPEAAIVSDVLLEPAPHADSTGGGPEERALETLRERYAKGAIDEVEFERRLEDLVGAETIEEARDRITDERQTAPPEPEVEQVPP